MFYAYFSLCRQQNIHESELQRNVIFIALLRCRNGQLGELLYCRRCRVADWHSL